jgi:prepilin-type N-terminal cleavage/methylation domain-containing protein
VRLWPYPLHNDVFSDSESAEMCKRTDRGFTLIELLMVVAIIAIIAAIAVPGLLRARLSGNEASAIGSTRAIVSAQQSYFAMNRGYATTLDVLATMCPGVTIPFISTDLATNGVTKSGYFFAVVPGDGATVGPSDSCGTASNVAFYATATPLHVGTTGTRAFAADGRMVLWYNVSGVAPLQPFTVSATDLPLGR